MCIFITKDQSTYLKVNQKLVLDVHNYSTFNLTNLVEMHVLISLNVNLLVKKINSAHRNVASHNYSEFVWYQKQTEISKINV